MKIGINASFARKPSTGIGQVTVNFLKKLAAQKTDDEYILYLEEDLPEDIKLPKNFQKRIFLPFWKRDDLVRKILWEKYLLPGKIEKDGCEIFLSLYQSPTVVPEDIEHMIVVHDIVPKLFPEYLNNYRKRKYWNLTEEAIRKADKILAVSSRTEKDLIQHLGIDPKKITVNHIDCDEIYKKAITPTVGSKVLKKYKLKPGYIYNGGGLEVRKNTLGVIQAYKYLLERNKNEHFLHEMPKLVISGRLLPKLKPLVDDIEAVIKDLDLSNHVEILDFVPQADLPALYKNAIMFVYPSYYEGFGLPVLEAMNVGTPVVTAKSSSLPEIGQDGVLYCEPKDHKDIAMVMKNVLINPELRASLSARGKERAQKFSWEKFITKIFNIIEEL